MFQIAKYMFLWSLCKLIKAKYWSDYAGRIVGYDF